MPESNEIGLSGGIKYRGTVGQPVDAYLSRPRNVQDSTASAVIIVPELWGMVDHMKDIADRFARQGIVGLVPDLYSSQEDLAVLLTPANIEMFLALRDKLPADKPISQMLGDLQSYLKEETTETIRTMQQIIEVFFGGKMPKEKLLNELGMAREYLLSQNWVKRGSVGVVGFCFGGELSLSLASRTSLDACVSYYGGNPNPIESVGDIQCPILGLYGAEDTRVNSKLDKLVGVLAQHKKDFEIRVYAGAPHAFFNDSRSSYNAASAQDAWRRTLSFLRYSFSRA